MYGDRATDLRTERSSTRSVERREHHRYGVRALVNFEWMDKGMLRREKGQTRDISSKGMFIYSDCGPSTKADVEVEVFLSPVGGAVSTVRISAKALVIRVEPTMRLGESTGFAILNKSYKLCSGAPIED